MITNVHIGHSGRLGNQLFQYAILKAISNKTGYQITLPTDLSTRVWHGQECVLGNFKLPSCRYSDTQPKFMYEEPDPRYYDDGIYNIPDNTSLSGFFQHPGYYVGMQNDLRVEFELHESIRNKILQLLSNYKTPTASLHMRRGDLSDGSTGNPVDVAWSNDYSKGSVVANYYTTALSMIPSDSTIFLFTGGSRNGKVSANDIQWCMEHFNDSRIIYLDGLSDIETFTLMSMCDYNITSFASTFSWWASFLNKNENIIAPKIYYPSNPSLTPDLVYPKNWTLI